jgi:hypothetical protein
LILTLPSILLSLLIPLLNQPFPVCLIKLYTADEACCLILVEQSQLLGYSFVDGFNKPWVGYKLRCQDKCLLDKAVSRKCVFFYFFIFKSFAKEILNKQAIKLF